MRSKKSNQSTAAKSSSLIASNSRHELPIIQQGENLLIDARILHQRLKSGYQFQDWIKKRIEEFGFKPGEDFHTGISDKTEKPKGGRPSIEIHLTLDMAKELAMLERNEIGRAMRRYFILKEKESRKPVINFEPLAGFKLDEFTRGLKPFKINNQLLWPYQDVLRKIGFSNKASSSNRKKNYGQHFLKVGQILYITDQFAKHLAHSRCVYVNRIKMKETQPLLPFNFGESNQLMK